MNTKVYFTQQPNGRYDITETKKNGGLGTITRTFYDMTISESKDLNDHVIYCYNAASGQCEVVFDEWYAEIIFEKQPSELEQQLDQVMNEIEQQLEREIVTVCVRKEDGIVTITDLNELKPRHLPIRARGSVKKAAEQYIHYMGYDILKMDDWSKRKVTNLMYSYQVTKVLPKVPTETIQPTKR